MTATANIVEIRGLAKRYRGWFGRAVHALQGVDLDVRQGEVFGLLGPNGAGKTTMVRILLSITRASGGNARLFGENPSAPSVKSRLGYLAENHRYPRYQTGQQVLEYFGMLGNLTGQALRKRIDECLELVRMTEWRKMKIAKYSKGMMQRIGLAQAMINDPQLMFLDEPTDGVDPVGRKEIRDLLKHMKERGKTIFLNSHLLSEVEQICDRVAILNKGKLIRMGTLQELTSGESNRYGIELHPGLDGAGGVLAEHGFEAALKDGKLELNAATVEQLNAAIDLLRSRKIMIKAVTPLKQSLEDLFIQVVTSEEGRAS